MSRRWRRVGLFACASLLGACSSVSSPAGRHSADDVKSAATRAEESYAKGDWRTAAEAYRVLVDAMPQDANLWFRYANALTRADQPDQAVRAYREVLVRDARYSKAWFNMGIVQLREAANSFQHMQGNIAPDDPMGVQARQAYAAVMKILGEGDGARTDAGPPAGSGAEAPPDVHDPAH